MIIRKLYKFENAHVVRNCTSERCKFSIHGHSYKVEVLLKGTSLDNGQMLYDFGLMKNTIHDFLDSFDHAITLWDQDKEEYLNSMKSFSSRWISLPVSPSAEQFSRVFFLVIDAILENTQMNNNESDVNLVSVIVHETDTGYAQCFKEDAYSEKMGLINIDDILFSEQVRSEWKDPFMFINVIRGIPFTNPVPIQQVVVK